VNDPKDPRASPPIEPITGVRPVASDEFAKKVAAQINGTNGANGHAAMSEGFYEAGEEADEAKEESNREPVMPHDMDAEGAVMSALLLDPEALPKIRDFLRPEHFYSDAHRLIYRTCLDLEEDGIPIDVVTVAVRLKKVDRVGQVGGMAYLTQILDATAAVTNVRHHANEVFRLSTRRLFINACKLARLSLFDETDPTRSIEFLRSHIDTFKPRDVFTTPVDIISRWEGDGALVHEPTGIPSIDNATGGGPVYGTRWIVNGAPDAGKTALLVQIGHTYALKGIAVGFLAADEESDDLQTRLAQRTEFSRIDCEIRNPNTTALLKSAFRDLPVRFYRSDATIETASDDLALWAHQRGSRAVLIVDSMQTVTCSKNLGNDKLSVREFVTANVHAFKNCAIRHKLIALATSEMNRAAYKNGNSSEQSDMASGAESRALEFSARVLMTLRSVKGEPDLVEIAIPKNKHGPSGTNFYLRIDRRRMTLYESEGPASAPTPEAAKEDERALKERLAAEVLASREASAALARQELHLKEEALLLSAVAEQPGIGVHELRAAVAAKLGGCGRARVDDAIARLGKRLRIEAGPRGAKLHYLN
jgi:replicative DNA helicase